MTSSFWLTPADLVRRIEFLAREFDESVYVSDFAKMISINFPHVYLVGFAQEGSKAKVWKSYDLPYLNDRLPATEIERFASEEAREILGQFKKLAQTS